MASEAERLTAGESAPSVTPESAMAIMSRAFGQSFDDVELDPDAAAEAESHRAAAFTQGRRIAFNAGQYAPQTPRGEFTLAHELAHVVQLRAGADPTAADERARLERQADRVATSVLAGQKPQLPAPLPNAPAPATDGPILRQDPETEAAPAEPAAVPLVMVGPESDALDRILRVYATGGRGEEDIAVFFFAGRSLRGYRGRRFGGVFPLAETAAAVGPGVYTEEGDLEGGLIKVVQLYRIPGRGEVITRGVGAGEGENRQVDQVAPEALAEYERIAGGAWRFYIQFGGGAGSGAGGATTEQGPQVDGGGGEGATTPALPDWAAAMHAGLQRRLRAEQTRLAELAQRTIGDIRPETLLRLYSLEGVPKRLGIGFTDQLPAELVIVDRTNEGRIAETTTGVLLNQRDSVDLAWERVLTAARALYLGLPVSEIPAVPQEESPIGLVGEGTIDPEAVRANTAAYPSYIRYYGPPIGVVDVPHAFTMELDWSVEGEFAWAGPFALRSYNWAYYRIRDLSDASVTEAEQRGTQGEAAGAVLERGFSDIGEDIESSTIPELVVMGGLTAIDTALRSAGTLVKSWATLVSQPSNEQAIRFGQPGTYVIVATSAQVPAHRTEDIPNPVVRAPSVAVYALRIERPRDLAQQTVAPTELATARSELVRLAGEAQEAPESDQAALQEALAAQQAEVDRLTEIEGQDLATFLTASLAQKERELEILDELILLEQTFDPPEEWSNFEARIMRVSLRLHHLTAEEAFAQTRAARDLLRVQLRSLSEVTDLKAGSYRPHVSFVPDADGRVLPVVMLLGERSDSSERRQRWVLIDVSVSGHRDRYEGSSTAGGAAGAAEAIRNAFEDFAAEIPYGRGEIGIRLPEPLVGLLEGHSVPSRMRAHPGFNARFWQRLESLATAAAIAGLVATGPVGVAVGVIGGVAGGAVAVHRGYQRYSGGYLEPDLQTAMDVAAIVGAFASVAGPIASSVREGSRFVRTADWVERGVEIYGYVQLGTSFILVPLSYFNELRDIPENLSPGEKAARRAEAFLRAVNTSLQLAVSAAQMISHATSGPRQRRPAATPGEEGPVPRVEEPPARPGEQEPVPRAGEEEAPAQRPGAEETPPAQAREGATDLPDPENIEQVGIEHGMVIMAQEGRTLSRPYAQELFGNVVRNTPLSEVALLRNAETGDFLVVIGDGSSVHLGEGNPNWREILPERAQSGRWVLEEHSHAADPATGFTPYQHRWPSGADGDFLVVVNEARLTGEVARGRIRLHTPTGEQVTEYAYHPGAARPYEVDIALPGGRYQKRYATIEDYLADFTVRTGEPAPGQVPDSFPGARRTPPPTRPGPETGQPPETPTPGRGTEGGEAGVPPPARAPTPEAEAPARSRQQQLTALEQTARDAAESGDSARVAEANQRLLAYDGQLRAGYEDTGLTGRQIAKMLDAGLPPDQVHALRQWLGESTGAYVGRQDIRATQLEVLGRVAADLAPVLNHPDVVAALARFTTDGLGPYAVARRLDGVPTNRLVAFMGIVADPFIRFRSLSENQLAVLRDPDVIDLVARYRNTVWDLMGTTYDPRRAAVLTRLARDVAANPAAGPDLVQAVVKARNIRAREQVLELPNPPRAVRRRPEVVVAPDPDDVRWGTHTAAAEQFVADHPEWLAYATRPRPDGSAGPTRAQLEVNLATMYQVQERARFGHYESLTHQQKVQVLDNFIAIAREIGFTGQQFGGIGNQASGALSESLFVPPGARTQIQLPHPEGGFSRPDFELPDTDLVIPGRRNMVEHKSDELSSQQATGINADDVGKARKYVRDGVDDAPALYWADDAAHLIEFVREPNQVTRVAMMDVLLAELSPFQAARVGGGRWYTKQEWLALRLAGLTE